MALRCCKSRLVHLALQIFPVLSQNAAGSMRQIGYDFWGMIKLYYNISAALEVLVLE